MPTGKRAKKGQEESSEGVSDVRAILASDIHLSQRCPVARNAEEDWFVAMARPLQQLAAFQDIA